MIFMQVLTMYKDMNNRKAVEQILSRPEWTSSVRSADQNDKRKRGLKEILAMKESAIYEYLKKTYNIK